MEMEQIKRFLHRIEALEAELAEAQSEVVALENQLSDLESRHTVAVHQLSLVRLDSGYRHPPATVLAS